MLSSSRTRFSYNVFILALKAFSTVRVSSRSPSIFINVASAASARRIAAKSFLRRSYFISSTPHGHGHGHGLSVTDTSRGGRVEASRGILAKALRLKMTACVHACMHATRSLPATKESAEDRRPRRSCTRSNLYPTPLIGAGLQDAGHSSTQGHTSTSDFLSFSAFSLFSSFSFKTLRSPRTTLASSSASLAFLC